MGIARERNLTVSDPQGIVTDNKTTNNTQSVTIYLYRLFFINNLFLSATAKHV